MSSERTCKECGTVIPADTPGGFCAQCLLALGLGPSDLRSGRRSGDGQGLDRCAIAASGEPKSPFETKSLGASAILPAQMTEQAGDRIGRYRLLQEIGRGGCGVVYMAEQEEPVRRRVALKVIKLGMDTRQVVARFEAERQALALMEHQNIAKVLDAGTTEAGRPYFVMELVRGTPITDYCDQNQVPPSERLRLFVQVCQAVQHAHQKGIIHRDLKPSNILVTLHDGVPVPKVIDFGIAKATQGRLTDQTLFTAFQQFIGTPAYMSPEQAEMSGLDIDTRSDIYSLGVLLYELLVGTTPLAAKELLAAGLDQMVRTIREQEPVRPSTRLATMLAAQLTDTARRRHTEAPKLIHLVRGDLDWIVMKCLEKDRTRRYETANGLAMDIQRHMSNEPVVARPPNTIYRVQKFVRRNKVVAMATGAVTMALAFGVVASTWQAVRAARQARLAREESRRATIAAEALRQSLYVADLGLVSQAWDSGNAERARDLLEQQRPTNKTDLRGFEWRYLYGITRAQELCTVKSRADEVWASAISPDDHILATGGNDGTAQLWDMQTGRELAALSTGSGGDVYSLAFSPDGKTLAMPNSTDTIYLWDLETRKLRGFLRGATNSPVVSVAFSPDGQSIVSVGGWVYDTDKPGEILIWDAASLQPRVRLTGHRASVGLAAFSPDGSVLATPMGDGTILLWDIRSGQIVKRMGSHRGLAFAAAFSRDGKLLASGGIDGAVRLWDLATGQKPGLLGLHSGPVYSVAFSCDGKRLASASLDHTAKIWDVHEGRELTTLKGHSGRVFSASFSRDGKYLVTGSIDGTAKVWRLPEKGEPDVFARHQGTFASVGFSPDGRWLIREAGEETALWDVATRTPRRGLTASGAAFSPDGRHLAGIHESSIELWDVAGVEPHHLRTIPARAKHSWTKPCFSPDGRLLAVANEGNSITLWRTDQWTEVASLKEDSARGQEINAYVFSPDGSLLATGKQSGEIRLWNTRDWSKARALVVPQQDSYHLAFSPDGRWLATGGRDAIIRLFEVATGNVHDLRADAVSIWCLAFTHDGKTLAAGNHDGAVKFWNVAARREIMTLRAHSTILCGLAFSPDDTLLATICVDQTMRLWSAPALPETDAQRH